MAVPGSIQDDHIDLEVAFNIAHYIGDGGVFFNGPRLGRFYMDQSTIYIVCEENWYKIDIGDIRDVLIWSDTRELELIFDSFNICLSADSYPPLCALRDLLASLHPHMGRPASARMR